MIRSFALCGLLVLCGLFVATLGREAAAAEVSSHIPPTVSQIGDETLRMAVSMYAPHYDSLSYQAKLAAYVNVYKSLYNGAMPPLTGDDSLALSRQEAARAAASVRVEEAPRYEPWQDPYWHPMHEKTGVLSRGMWDTWRW